MIREDEIKIEYHDLEWNSPLRFEKSLPTEFGAIIDGFSSNNIEIKREPIENDVNTGDQSVFRWVETENEKSIELNKIVDIKLLEISDYTISCNEQSKEKCVYENYCDNVKCEEKEADQLYNIGLKMEQLSPKTRKLHYKYCIVPKCRTTTIKNPEKHFLYLPFDKKKRNKWLKAIRRHPLDISRKSCVYVCEDHFDLKNDMENYVRFRLQGGRIQLKPNIVPHLFGCQSDMTKQTVTKPQRLTTLKRNCIQLLK